MMKFTTYIVFSVMLMLGTVYYAYYTYRQFYPTVLFLVSSKFAYIVIGNLMFAVALLVARIFKSLFFGQLRDTEVELLVDTAKYTIPETCLALTIFRNELSPAVIALFGTLIFIKLLHKLSKCRIEYMEQLLPLPVASQARVYLLLTALYVIDFIGVFLSVTHITNYGRSVLILFGFEFGLLIIYSVNMTVRFVIQVVDAMTEVGMSSKGLYLMLTDMICEIVKFLTYLCFFGLIFVYYGIPIHILRDVYMAYTSCARKVVSFVKYLQLTRNLDSRFEDATPEEVAAAGHCLVCREDLTQGKKLRCGHVFHLDCLRMWLQHQQSCPLCRANISVSETAPAAAAPVADAAAAPAVAGDAGADVGAAAPGVGAVLEAERGGGPVGAAAPGVVGPAVVGVAPAPHGVPIGANAAAPGARPTPAPLQQQALAQSANLVQAAPAIHSVATKESGPTVFGVQLRSQKALRAQQAPLPGFYMVAAQPDVPVMRDPVHNSVELRRIKTATYVFVTLRVMGGDGTSWLKAPDGWILECTISTNSALPTLYSVVAGPVGLRNEEDSQEEPDSEDKARTDIAQQSTVLLSIGESSTVDAAATADTSRFYSREHQRSSRLFEQFETTSKRTPADADAGAKIDGSAAKSSSGDFGKTSSSSSTRPPFSAIIYGSDNEEADEGAHPSCPAPSSAAASATALRRDHHRGRTSDASAEQQQQQIEDCLQTLQGLLERHRGGGKRYGDLYQAVASSASTANRSSQTGKVEEVPRKLQRLVDMQSQMGQVAENLVALSNNVIHCQQTLQGMIADYSAEVVTGKNDNQEMEKAGSIL